MVSQGFTSLQMAQSLKCLLELMIFPFQRWDLSWFPALEGSVIHRHTFLQVFSWTFQKAEVQIKNKKLMLTQMTPPTTPLCNILLMEIRLTSWYSKYSTVNIFIVGMVWWLAERLNYTPGKLRWWSPDITHVMWWSPDCFHQQYVQLYGYYFPPVKPICL